LDYGHCVPLNNTKVDSEKVAKAAAAAAAGVAPASPSQNKNQSLVVINPNGNSEQEQALATSSSSSDPEPLSPSAIQKYFLFRPGQAIGSAMPLSVADGGCSRPTVDLSGPLPLVAPLTQTQHLEVIDAMSFCLNECKQNIKCISVSLDTNQTPAKIITYEEGADYTIDSANVYTFVRSG
jgi:hypothetical protein